MFKCKKRITIFSNYEIIKLMMRISNGRIGSVKLWKSLSKEIYKNYHLLRDIKNGNKKK